VTIVLRRAPSAGAPLVLGYHVGERQILPAVPASWGLATALGGYTSAAIVAEARSLAGDAPLVLVGWSAGCQAVRQLLRAGVEPLAVVALDGAHASLPVEPWQVETWADYALRGLLVLTCTRQTYVEQLPRGRYASTLRIASMLLGADFEQLLDGAHGLGRGRVEVHPSGRIDGPAHAREVTEHLPRILREIVVPALADEERSPVAQGAPSLGARVLEVARSQLGVTETPSGSNTGREIRGYLAPCVRGGRRVGLTAGEWCAAFASWCVWLAWAEADEWGAAEIAAMVEWREAGGEAPPIGYRCAVHELVSDARASGAWRGPESAEVPLPGDLLVFGRAGSDPTRGGLGHVAVCEAWSAAANAAISGNDGNAVRRREWSGSAAPWGPLLGWVRTARVSGPLRSSRRAVVSSLQRLKPRRHRRG